MLMITNYLKSTFRLNNLYKKNYFIFIINYKGMSLDLKLNDNIRPQDDFYSYVNLNWIKENPIPSDLQRWGTFNELGIITQKKLLNLLNKLTYSENKEFNTLKVLYNQGMDIKRINSKSPKDYTKFYTQKINNSKSKDELLKNVFDIHVLHGINTPFNFQLIQI